MNPPNSPSRIGILLVLWKAQRFVEPLLLHLQKQTNQDFDLYLYDNGSTEEVRRIKEVYPNAQVFGHGLNTGFAHANNVLMRKAHNPYVLLCNQDILLHERCVEVLHRVIASGLRFGSLALKLRKAQFAGDFIEKTHYFDTTGLQVFKNRHTVERDAGKEDVGQYKKITPVFGASGALVLYKKEALDVVSYKGEYFDESFISYKEDVDLAWRLQYGGFDCYFVPHAAAWHFRGLATTPLHVEAQKTERKKRNPILKRYSYANHLCLLYKHENLYSVVVDGWRIAFYEAKKFLYLWWFEPKTLLGWKDLFMRFSRIAAYKRHMRPRVKRSLSEIRKHFV